MTTLVELPGLAGQRLGPTEWREMTQERVNEFADVTEDHNYIHVDPERAKDSPFGGTIAHGYLSVALLAPISQQLLDVSDAGTSVNYGLDRLRFPAPLRVGAQFRGFGEVAEITEIKGGMQVKVTFTLEVRDQERPALVADCLFRYYA
jgi:acyl dehydratase